ncbi:MAG: gfo/Idh/MocA family oxidoreductase, partial [Planctomycetota bacterium]
FTKTALAATAASYSRILGANDRIGIGYIGLGNRGDQVHEAFLEHGDQFTAAVCDLKEEYMDLAVKKSRGTPRKYRDYRRLLEDRDVDAVVIATPDHWHAPATILACDAGKDVYVEKPASHNIREGRLMVDAARRNGRIVQLGTQSRSRPWVIEAVERARSGELGRLLMAKAWDVQLRDDIGHKEDSEPPEGLDYDLYLGPTTWIPFNENRFHYKWHWHWHFGTGDAGNDGVHQIDVARWALGEEAPTIVSGMGRKAFFDDDQQTPDTMNVTFDYGDKLLQWEMRIWNPYGMEGVDNGVALYGSEAMMQIGRWGRRNGYRIFDREGKMVEDVEGDGSDFHARDFLDSMRSRKLPRADIG